MSNFVNHFSRLLTGRVNVTILLTLLFLILFGLSNQYRPVAGSAVSIKSQELVRSISGSIVDTNNNPIAGARVDVPGFGATTSGSGGRFSVGGLNPSTRLPVRVTANGFVQTTRIYIVVANRNIDRTIVLQRRSAPVIFDADAGGRLTFGGNGGVDIPPGALVNPEGETVRGAVTAQVTYIDPTDPAQLNTAPGDFRAVMSDGSQVQLETVGMVDILILDQRGDRADLARGQTAQLNMPLPGGARPTDVSSFGFDPASGDWVQDSGFDVSPDGTIRTQIPSILPAWNADRPLETAVIRVCVKDLNGVPRPGVFVNINGIDYSGLSQGYTGDDGCVCIPVRANSVIQITAGNANTLRQTPGPGPNCVDTVPPTIFQF